MSGAPDDAPRALQGRPAAQAAGFPEEVFATFFDLHLGIFVRPPRREAPAPHHLPLTEVLDSARLLEWLFTRNVPPAERAAAFHVGKRIREYAIPAYVVTTDDEGAVREIFRRANNTGKRMDDSDMFNALYSAGGVPSSLADVAEGLQAVGIGRLDESTLYNMMQATRGKEARKGAALDLSPPEARQALADLMNAGRATLAFCEPTRISPTSPSCRTSSRCWRWCASSICTPSLIRARGSCWSDGYGAARCSVSTAG